jgi:hypothetical protein
MMNKNLPVKRIKRRPYSISMDRDMLSLHDSITITVPPLAWAEALFRARKEVPHMFEEGAEPTLKTLAVTLLALDEVLSKP